MLQIKKAMAYMIIGKKKLMKKITDKCQKMPDMIVFDQQLYNETSVSFVDFAPTVKVNKTDGIRSATNT